MYQAADYQAADVVVGGGNSAGQAAVTEIERDSKAFVETGLSKVESPD